MGTARRKVSMRRVPDSPDLDLRLDAQDRPGGPHQPERAPRRIRDNDSEPPPRRKKRRRGGGGGKRSGFGRFVYWSAVLGLWMLIAAIGGSVWIGAHLPPIQSLEIPKRPPSIQIVGLYGRVLAIRGDMG